MNLHIRAFGFAGGIYTVDYYCIGVYLSHYCFVLPDLWQSIHVHVQSEGTKRFFVTKCYVLKPVECKPLILFVGLGKTPKSKKSYGVITGIRAITYLRRYPRETGVFAFHVSHFCQKSKKAKTAVCHYVARRSRSRRRQRARGCGSGGQCPRTRLVQRTSSSRVSTLSQQTNCTRTCEKIGFGGILFFIFIFGIFFLIFG